MAKRIEFIAPVEAMRGNLSGRQNLLYAENDNKAYYGPVGSKNYARNYTTRFIGAKRVSDGRKYFSVRTKTANHLTPAAKSSMALMGGTGAIVASIMRNKTLTPYVEAYAQWIELVNMGSTMTFRQTLTGWVRQGLATKSATIAFTGPRTVYSIQNPWISNEGTQTVGAEISLSVIFKFAQILGPDHLALIEMDYNGPAGDNINIKVYQRTNESWYDQVKTGGSMSQSWLGTYGYVNGLLEPVRRLVADDSSQVHIGIGSGQAFLTGTPLWIKDETDVAVTGADEPTTDLRYVVHPQ